VKRRALVRKQFLIVGSVVAALYLFCPFRLGVVYGQSMAPTLRPGELCLLDRAYYSRNPVQVGDVIVFRKDGSTLTKRVYGAPGQEISLLWYGNDSTYDLPPTYNPARLKQIYARYHGFVRAVRYPVPEGYCFVVGDNTPVSWDSREFGPIPTSSIIGKMVSKIN